MVRNLAGEDTADINVKVVGEAEFNPSNVYTAKVQSKKENLI